MDGGSTMLTSNEVLLEINHPKQERLTRYKHWKASNPPNVITSIVVNNIQVDFLCSVVSFFFVHGLLACTWVSCTNYTLELVVWPVYEFGAFVAFNYFFSCLIS